jgi:hypothetical protein
MVESYPLMDTDCLFMQEGVYRVDITSEDCSLDELQALLDDIGAELNHALMDLLKQGKRFGPVIGKDLKELMYDGIYYPVLSLLDPTLMNCRLFAHAWDNISGGMCYEVIGTITKQTFIVILEGILSLVLMFLMFGLWRYFIDNRVAWKESQRVKFAMLASPGRSTKADPTSIARSNATPMSQRGTPSLKSGAGGSQGARSQRDSRSGDSDGDGVSSPPPVRALEL